MSTLPPLDLPTLSPGARLIITQTGAGAVSIRKRERAYSSVTLLRPQDTARLALFLAQIVTDTTETPS